MIDVADTYLRRRAAQHPAAANLVCPFAVFNNTDYAPGRSDIAAGLVTTAVECDRRKPESGERDPPADYRQGDGCTGGAAALWINGGDEVEDKLHLDWRLALPPRDEETLIKFSSRRAPSRHRYRRRRSDQQLGEPSHQVVRQLAPQIRATAMRDSRA